MRDATIARNYAEALFELARRAGDLEGWGRMIRDVGDAVEQDARLRRFLESPKVSASQKNAILTSAFQDRMPRLMVRFLQTLVHNRRQTLIPHVAREYQAVLDEMQGRVHASVTVARQPSERDVERIAQLLGRRVGKTVVPHIALDPSLVGGVVVRIGDEVMDGSVRRRLRSLRRQVLAASISR